MITPQDELYNDLERVRKIPVVPVMLDVICEATGLGFAAVARVTETRWMTCGVLDRVKFGLKEGDELQLKTTLCDEIRDSHEAIVIDHVANDAKYALHHTPKTYGLQSYISYPIILRDGRFFGTLCAIGTEPAQLDNIKIRGMFALFAELLSFYLESIEHLEKNHSALKESNRQLMHSNKENLLYQEVTSHHLQEPLRKIGMFSDILMNFTDNNDVVSAKETARKINRFSGELSGMISHIADFSSIEQSAETGRAVNLNEVVKKVLELLQPKIKERNLRIISEELPTVVAVPSHMSRLFYSLLEHAIELPDNDPSHSIKIRLSEPEVKTGETDFYSIFIEQNNGISKTYDPDAAFDLLVHTSGNEPTERYKAGLAICQKIMQSSNGELSVHSAKGSGISFCIKLPVNFTKPAHTLASSIHTGA